MTVRKVPLPTALTPARARAPLGTVRSAEARAPRPPVRAYAIALGANRPSPVGPPRTTFRSALAMIADIPGTHVVACSRLRITKPVGMTDQPAFLNGAALIKTPLAPAALLRALLTIEARHGRDRATSPRWGPRTLDLDLLFAIDRKPTRTKILILPHPRLHERLFVLEPLAEILPGAIVRGLNATVLELRDAQRTREKPAGLSTRVGSRRVRPISTPGPRR